MKPMLFLFIGLILSGCASQVPLVIRQQPQPDPTLSQVTNQIDTYKQQFVRWGGSILKVSNRPNDTEIEILAQELDSAGKPVDGDETLGRFLLRKEGFFDPAVYAKGRLLTVYGSIETGVSRNIGEKPYLYPLIKAQALYLWPRASEYSRSDYYPYGYYRPYGYFSAFGYYPYRRYGFGYRRANICR